jgi:hypothetical protein
VLETNVEEIDASGVSFLPFLSIISTRRVLIHLTISSSGSESKKRVFCVRKSAFSGWRRSSRKYEDTYQLVNRQINGSRCKMIWTPLSWTSTGSLRCEYINALYRTLLLACSLSSQMLAYLKSGCKTSKWGAINWIHQTALVLSSKMPCIDSWWCCQLTGVAAAQL